MSSIGNLFALLFVRQILGYPAEISLVSSCGNAIQDVGEDIDFARRLEWAGDGCLRGHSKLSLSISCWQALDALATYRPPASQARSVDSICLA